LKVESEAQARVRIDTGVAARGVALDALLIGVSSFFRDPVVFDTIRTHVIPALRARLRPPRVWSVGCSSGAELYSVGILLASAGLLDGAELLGTDCRPDAVARARSGLFDHDAMSDLDGEVRQRFFERTHGGWRIDRSLRDRVTWSVADATTTLARGPWDLVLCRNVVIYLRAVAGDALLQRIAGALAPGGFLVVGKAERPRVPSLTLVNRCTYRNDVSE
jgi:chemotaxis methyl-accepting protein methylase